MLSLIEIPLQGTSRKWSWGPINEYIVFEYESNIIFEIRLRKNRIQNSE
jgi:hypothetical protein